MSAYRSVRRGAAIVISLSHREYNKEVVVVDVCKCKITCTTLNMHLPCRDPPHLLCRHLKPQVILYSNYNQVNYDAV